MGKKVFLVCGNLTYGTGHPVENKVVVIEAELDESGGYADVIAPQGFVEKWPHILVAGSMERWRECQGPARLLTEQEWQQLLQTLS